jgi:hypothetical protein
VIGLHVELTILGEYDGALTNILAILISSIVVGRLYSVQYKGIFGTLDKVRHYTSEEARPSRLDFQRDEVKIHHVIASMQDCWS